MKRVRLPLDEQRPFHLPAEAIRGLPRADARRVRAILQKAEQISWKRMNAAVAAIEEHARLQIEQARAQAEAAIEAAQREALALLCELPDFDEMEAVRGGANGRSVQQIVREVADRFGAPMVLATTQSKSPRAIEVKRHMIRAVADEMPELPRAQLRGLFRCSKSLVESALGGGAR